MMIAYPQPKKRYAKKREKYMGKKQPITKCSPSDQIKKKSGNFSHWRFCV
jgi:hypothetical protein